MRSETEGHFLVGTVILGFLTIFKKSQASSTFEALNSMSLSTCQSDVRPVVQMRWGTRARDDMASMELTSSSCAEIGVPQI